MKITGGCHCGAIRYEAEVDPATAGICHCTDCQVLSGTAFRVSIRIDQRQQLRPAGQIWLRSQLPWLGELAALPGVDQQR